MNTQTMKLSPEFIAPMIEQCDASYKARTLPHEQNLSKKTGVQVDCARALDTLHHDFTPGQWAHLESLALGPDVLEGFARLARATSTKVPLRAVNLLHFVAGGPVPPASARTFALALTAMVTAGCKTRDGLQFAVTGRGNENTSDGVNVARARQVLTRIGATSPASFDTQFSVSFSPDGLGAVFGIGRGGKKNEMPQINPDAPFAKAIVARVAALTEIEIDTIKESVEKSATKAKAKGKGKGSSAPSATL